MRLESSNGLSVIRWEGAENPGSILLDVCWSHHIIRKCFHCKSNSFSNKISNCFQQLPSSSLNAPGRLLLLEAPLLSMPVHIPVHPRSLKLVCSFPASSWCTGTSTLYACPLLGSLLLKGVHYSVCNILACLVILPQLVFSAKIIPSSVGKLSFQFFQAIFLPVAYLVSMLSTPQSSAGTFSESTSIYPWGMA